MVSDERNKAPGLRGARVRAVNGMPIATSDVAIFSLLNGNRVRPNRFSKETIGLRNDYRKIEKIATSRRALAFYSQEPAGTPRNHSVK